MNATDNVRRAFRSKYSFDIQTTWLQACLTWLRDQFQLPDLTNQYALEKIYNQWLHTDISLIADAHYLPNDLDLNAKKVQLTGKYPLQINRILCISEPYYSQVLDIHGDLNENERIDTDITETQQWKPPPPKRVLYLELTDGKILLRGLEYEPISNLNRDTTLPGAKILVTGPVLFRRGMLLLTSKNTQILGGYVESLLDTNASLETALLQLSKTASKLEESRKRFDRLNFKVHPPIIDNAPIPIPNTRTNQQTATNTFDEHEDEMDEFIRQAYADGMLQDDSHVAPDPDPIEPQLSSTNRVPTPTNQHEELIVLSDDEIDPLDFDDFPTSTTIDQIPCQPSAPVLKISLPFTYLSLINESSLYSTRPHDDYLIKACFSSLVGNPKIVGDEFVQQAYINDGSDSRLIRFSSDILAQRLGMTATELLTRKKQCRDQFEQKQFQTEFNQRLKKFGQDIQCICSTMTIRIFSDKTLVPIVTNIDSN